MPCASQQKIQHDNKKEKSFVLEEIKISLCLSVGIDVIVNQMY
jgi:hypothetical protein